jgi:hypothetical protein
VLYLAAVWADWRKPPLPGTWPPTAAAGRWLLHFGAVERDSLDVNEPVSRAV